MNNCNLCNGKKSAILYKKNSYLIRRCNSCGLTFTDLLLSNNQLKELYSRSFFSVKGQDYYYFRDRLTNLKNVYMRINRIKQFFPGDKLLDVGCGFGFFLYVAKETWDSQGIELSDFASDFARDLTKTKVVNADFLNVEFSEESFGIITMWDFIEHVSNPLAVLRKANKIMKMHGLLVISTPDVGSPVARILGNKWYLLVPPLHLFYFNSDTISMLLKKSGFDIEKIEHKGKFFNIMYLAYRLGHLYPRYFSGRLYKSIVEQLSRIGFLANRSFYINTGDIMTVYAKKRKKIE